MVLFLTSSLAEYHDEETCVKAVERDRQFLDRLRAYWTYPVSFLVFASDPDDYHTTDLVSSKMQAYFQLAGMPIREMRTLDHRNMAEAETLLQSADVIFLAGGHASTENRFMKECHLKELLRSPAPFEGIVIGLCAGAMNCAEHCYMIPELPGEAADPGFEKDMEGLGLTNLNIVPHKTALETLVLDGKRMLEDILLPDSQGRKIFLIEDGSYFQIEGDETKFYGEGEIIENGMVRPIMRDKIDPQVFQSVIEDGYDCVAELEKSGEMRYIYLSPMLRQSGISEGKTRYYKDFIDIISRELAVEEEKQALLDETALDIVFREAENEACYARTIHLHLPDGRHAEDFRVRMTADGTLGICILRDNTEILDHDWMTNVYSRNGFLAEAEKLLGRLDLRERYAVLYTNIMGFKAVNEIFGEESGDQVILQIRDRLRETFHPLLIGRFESEHFTLIVRASFLSEENLNRLRTHDFTKGLQKYTMRIHIGIYRIDPEDLRSGLTITRMTDLAKLAEENIRKMPGTLHAAFSEEMRAEYMQREAFLSGFRDALEGKEFRPYFQPIVETSSGRIVCAEALVRWIRLGGKIVPPGQFVPVFEAAGRISEIDRSMMHEVMRFLSWRMKRGNFAVPCSVNLSRIDFYDAGMIREIHEMVSSEAFPPSLLKLEVTETAYLELETDAVGFLEEMRNLGVKILLDDFGSGKSNLSSLGNFQFDTIKLDMGFIRKIGVSRSVEAVIHSVIDLAHSVGSTVVAEGVETEQQLSFLKEEHCDMIQGYLFYRPMPETDFSKLLDYVWYGERLEKGIQ